MPKTHRVRVVGIVSNVNLMEASALANDILDTIPVGPGSPFWEVQVSYVPSQHYGGAVVHNILIAQVVEHEADYDAAFPEKIMAACPRCGVLYDPRHPDRPFVDTEEGT